MHFRMHYDEVLPDDGCGWERKRFTYDRATHYSYKFMVSGEFYSVVARHINSEHELNQLGYTLPQACSFPAPLMAEVYFDRFHDIESFGNFFHYASKGLGNGTVLLNVASLMLEHYKLSISVVLFFKRLSPLKPGLSGRQIWLRFMIVCLG